MTSAALHRPEQDYNNSTPTDTPTCIAVSPAAVSLLHRGAQREMTSTETSADLFIDAMSPGLELSGLKHEHISNDTEPDNGKPLRPRLASWPLDHLTASQCPYVEHTPKIESENERSDADTSEIESGTSSHCEPDEFDLVCAYSTRLLRPCAPGLSLRRDNSNTGNDTPPDNGTPVGEEG